MDDKNIKKAFQEKASKLTPLEVPSIASILRKKRNKVIKRRQIYTSIGTVAVCFVISFGIWSGSDHSDTNGTMKVNEMYADVMMRIQPTNVPIMDSYIKEDVIKDEAIIGSIIAKTGDGLRDIEGVETGIAIYNIRESNDVAIKLDDVWHRFTKKEQ